MPTFRIKEAAAMLGVSYGTANLDAFTETRWVTMRGDIAPYPF